MIFASRDPDLCAAASPMADTAGGHEARAPSDRKYRWAMLTANALLTGAFHSSQVRERQNFHQGDWASHVQLIA